MLALELLPELDDRRSGDERADEQRVDERAEPLRARLRWDHRLRDRKDRRDRADHAREPERAEHDGRGDAVRPPAHDREVEAEQQRRRQPDRASGRAPEEATGGPPHERRGDERGDRYQREQQGAVGGPDLEVTQEPQVEPEPPAEEREAHGEEPERRVAERGDLPEPRQRVGRREVLVADDAVVVEHLLDLGSTAGHVAQPTGQEREHRGQRGEDEESGAPFRVAVEHRGARGDDEWTDDEADHTDRDVDREDHGSRPNGERVGEQRALDGHGCEHAGAGEGEDAEELPAVEGRARQQQSEDRHREQDTEDTRAVRRRAVGKVPERL